MQIINRQIFTGIVFFWVTLCATGQTKNDTIGMLTKKSTTYLNLLFNKRLPDSAAGYWTKNVFKDLAIGYNNGKISYKDESDLRTLFSKDFTDYFKNIRQQIRFARKQAPTLMYDDDGYKHFLIRFSMETSSTIDNSLKNIFLDFVSKDHGHSWLINDDHWIKQFMFVKYRK